MQVRRQKDVFVARATKAIVHVIKSILQRRFSRSAICHAPAPPAIVSANSGPIDTSTNSLRRTFIALREKLVMVNTNVEYFREVPSSCVAVNAIFSQSAAPFTFMTIGRVDILLLSTAMQGINPYSRLCSLVLDRPGDHCSVGGWPRDHTVGLAVLLPFASGSGQSL